MPPVEPDQPTDADSGGGTPDIVAVEIQRARQDAGLSVAELSKATGISKAVLHGYERGRTKPGARELRLLSETLRVSPNRLLLGTDDFETERPRFTALYRKFRTRPGLINIVGMMLFPMAAALLDEHEAESLLTLVDSLIRGKDPILGRRIAAMASSMASMLDQVTNEDGTVKSLTSEQMQALQKKALEEVEAFEKNDL